MNLYLMNFDIFFIFLGEKPYKCKFCDASFVQRTGLNVHIQTHHKEFANDEKVLYIYFLYNIFSYAE